jgi:hypothetical protein
MTDPHRRFGLERRQTVTPLAPGVAAAGRFWECDYGVWVFGQCFVGFGSGLWFGFGFVGE